MDILELKRLNRIEEVVNDFEAFKLKVIRGRYLTALAHDSFVVDVERQMYNWNSQGRHGDVLNFLQNEQGMDWKGALSYLAKRAGVELTMTADQQKRYAAARKKEDALDLILRFMEKKMGVSAATTNETDSPNEAEVSAGLDYARSRGWDDGRITAARLGFWDGDYKGLRAWLALHNVDMADPAVVAVLGFNGDVAQWFRLKRPNETPRPDWVEKRRITGIVPADMLIYPHLEAGRVQYLSGRKLVEDDYGKSWNLNQALVGKKRPFWNDLVRGSKGPILVVEGQADAISAAAWEVPAVALCGSAADDGLIEMLGKFDQAFICLDGDEAGSKNAGKLAKVLSNSRVVQFPEREGVTDVNDLFKAGMTRGQFKRLMTEGDVYAVWLCRQVDKADVLERERLAREAVAEYAKIDKTIRSDYRTDAVEALGWTAKRFDATVRAFDAEAKEKSKQKKSYKPELRKIGGKIDDILFETIHDLDQDMTQLACRFPDGEIKVVDRLEFDHYDVLPLAPDDPLLIGGWEDNPSLRLPSRPEEYGTTKDLINAIMTHIHEVLDVPEETEKMAAYWILMSWMADLSPVVPYLRAIGQTGSGKTRFVEAIGSGCFRAMFASGRSTAAFFKRVVDKLGMPTMVLDEMEYSNSDENNDVINWVNLGNRRGSFKLGLVAKHEDDMEAVMMNGFCMKTFSMRTPFGDEASNSRCWDWEANGLHPRKGIPTFLLPDFWRQAQQIRNMCLMYRLQNHHKEFVFDESKLRDKLPGRFREMIFGALTILPDLTEELNEMMEDKYQETVSVWRSKTEAKIVYAIIRCHFRPDPDTMEFDGENRLALKWIARETNRIMNIENATGAEGEDEERSRPNYKPPTARGTGSKVRRLLNLKTRSSDKGFRPRVVIWDEVRMKSLCDRYGFEREFMDLKEGYADPFDRQGEGVEKYPKRGERKPVLI